MPLNYFEIKLIWYPEILREDITSSPSLIERWNTFIEETASYNKRCESPRLRRSGSLSPKRCVSPARLPDIASNLSQFIDSIDYQKYGSVVEDVPEREWRLLATLARKRDQELEREKLADEFQKMWEKEKLERDLAAAKTMNQYKYYIHKKREQERLKNDFRNFQRETEDKVKTVMLLDSIRYKEKRSAKQLNWAQDIKAQELIQKAIESEARGLLAADRRTRKVEAEEWKRRTELEDKLRRLNNAQSKRDANIKNAARKVAISNALNSWESTILRQEALVLDEFRRAKHAAHAELTTLRSMRISRDRAMREKRARHVADFTQQLRDAVRMSRS